MHFAPVGGPRLRGQTVVCPTVRRAGVMRRRALCFPPRGTTLLRASQRQKDKVFCFSYIVCSFSAPTSSFSLSYPCRSMFGCFLLVSLFFMRICPPVRLYINMYTSPVDIQRMLMKETDETLLSRGGRGPSKERKHRYTRTYIYIYTSCVWAGGFRVLCLGVGGFHALIYVYICICICIYIYGFNASPPGLG